MAARSEVKPIGEVSGVTEQARDTTKTLALGSPAAQPGLVPSLKNSETGSTQAVNSRTIVRLPIHSVGANIPSGTETPDESPSDRSQRDSAGDDADVPAFAGAAPPKVPSVRRTLQGGADDESPGILDRIFNSEIRRAAATHIQEGAQFFGNPGLLKEAAQVISETLANSTHPVARQFTGFREPLTRYAGEPRHGDYIQRETLADSYFTYPAESGKPTIHVGFKDGRVWEIVYEQRSDGQDSPTIQETQIIFFGLSDHDAEQRGERKAVRNYYARSVNEDDGLRERTDEDYPPTGVYLNFTVLDTEDNTQARIHGLVGENTTKSSKRGTYLHGEAHDRALFPWVSNRIPPMDTFGLSVDNETLLPIVQTLTPHFYSRELFDGTMRQRSRRSKTERTDESTIATPQAPLDRKAAFAYLRGEGFLDREIMIMAEFADLVVQGLSQESERTVAELFELENNLNQREVAAHLLSVVGPIAMSDPKHGFLQGTSKEAVGATIKNRVLLGLQDVEATKREIGDISVYPSSLLYRSSPQVRHLLTAEGLHRMENFPEDVIADAIDYAKIIAETHTLLTRLGIPLSLRGRFFDEISALLTSYDYFPELQSLGVPREQIIQLRRMARSQDGFLIAISPAILNDRELVLVPGEDAADAEIKIVTQGRGLPYRYITGLHPLGPKAKAFLEELREKYHL